MFSLPFFSEICRGLVIGPQAMAHTGLGADF
jgi:hypothetical protein